MPIKNHSGGSISKFLVGILVVIGLGGCISSHRLQTVTETIRADRDASKKEIGMFATESNARVVIVDANKGRFCSEPPPETQLTENQTLRLLTEAAVREKSDQSAELKAELMRTYAQGLQQIYKRSHSNAMFRDASYYMCQAYLNGALTDKDLQAVLEVLSLSIDDGPRRKSFQEKSNDILRSLKGAEGGASSSSTYLVAQLWLAQLAFTSLEREVDKFYAAEGKINEGKVQAFEQNIKPIKDELEKVGASLDAVGSGVRSIQHTVEDTDKKIEKLANPKED